MLENKYRFSISILFCLLFLYTGANAQYVLKNSVFSNGGAVITDGSNYNLLSSTGQNLIGESDDNTYFAFSGFWFQSGHIFTAINDPFMDMPKTFQLYQNYPNPFNPLTNIKFALPKGGLVKIEVFNILGQRIATLLNAHKAAGYHIINFDANQFSSGLYFYTIQTENFHKARKMMLVK